MELEHRTPVSASLKNGQQAAVFKNDMANSELGEVLFQAFSKEMNMQKKGACAKCLSGEKIEYPDIMVKVAYKQFKKDNESCEGCGWYNPFKPQFPEKFTFKKCRH